MRLILASASPRRRELLEKTGVQFAVRATDVDETINEPMAPEVYVQTLASRKAMAAVLGKDEIVIGADTIVVFDNAIFGKPRDREDAAKMLAALSGKTHSVYTGVALRNQGGCRTFYEETQVTFYPLTPDEIEWYIDTGEPLDKAGAYGIQGKGCRLVRGICGDYSNVVGLPVAALLQQLHKIK
ncbi:MAG: Maf family protein [Oscillospiraceae bacterium]